MKMNSDQSQDPQGVGESFDPNKVQRVSFKADDGEDMELVDDMDYRTLLLLYEDARRRLTPEAAAEYGDQGACDCGHDDSEHVDGDQDGCGRHCNIEGCKCLMFSPSVGNQTWHHALHGFDLGGSIGKASCDICDAPAHWTDNAGDFRCDAHSYPDSSSNHEPAASPAPALKVQEEKAEYMLCDNGTYNVFIPCGREIADVDDEATAILVRDACNSQHHPTDLASLAKKLAAAIEHAIWSLDKTDTNRSDVCDELRTVLAEAKKAGLL